MLTSSIPYFCGHRNDRAFANVLAFGNWSHMVHIGISVPYNECSCAVSFDVFSEKFSNKLCTPNDRLLE